MSLYVLSLHALMVARDEGFFIGYNDANLLADSLHQQVAGEENYCEDEYNYYHTFEEVVDHFIRVDIVIIRRYFVWVQQEVEEQDF